MKKLFHFKIEKRSPIVIKGLEALNLPPRTVLLVLQSSRGSKGKVIVKTDDKLYPFYTLFNPEYRETYIPKEQLWGDNIGLYDFLVLKETEDYYREMLSESSMERQSTIDYFNKSSYYSDLPTLNPSP